MFYESDDEHCPAHPWVRNYCEYPHGPINGKWVSTNHKSRSKQTTNLRKMEEAPTRLDEVCNSPGCEARSEFLLHCFEHTPKIGREESKREVNFRKVLGRISRDYRLKKSSKDLEFQRELYSLIVGKSKSLTKLKKIIQSKVDFKINWHQLIGRRCKSCDEELWTGSSFQQPNGILLCEKCNPCRKCEIKIYEGCSGICDRCDHLELWDYDPVLGRLESGGHPRPNICCSDCGDEPPYARLQVYEYQYYKKYLCESCSGYNHPYDEEVGWWYENDEHTFEDQP